MVLDPRYAPIPATTASQLDLGDNGGIYSSRFNDFYFNPGQGAEESSHVFINGNRLNQRWTALAGANGENQESQFLIGETGFGTGLNFLTALHHWSRNAIQTDSSVELYYYAIEKHPLTRPAFKRALSHYNPYPELARLLLERYPDPVAGNYTINFADCGLRVKLVMIMEPIDQALEQLESYPTIESHYTCHKFDAWFLDGFSPKENQTMWAGPAMKKIAQLSKPGTTAATFTVAGTVKSNLRDAGFDIQKTAGFGRKREMLTATMTNGSRIIDSSKDLDPLKNEGRDHAACYYRYRRGPVTKKRATVAVIGAGIAGCCTAYQLARRGAKVMVFERASKAACGASGNDVAVIHPRTFKQRSLHADFFEASLHYARHFYAGVQDVSPASSQLPGGVFQLNADFTKTHALCEGELEHRWNHPNRSSKHSEYGIFYSNSGWLEPAALCARLLGTNNISVHYDSEITALTQQNKGSGSGWKLQTNKGEVQHVDSVVVACAAASNQLLGDCQLPLTSIRGQTTSLWLPGVSTELAENNAYCEEGYLVLQNQLDGLSLHYGASYDKFNNRQEPSKLDCLANIDALCDIASIDPHLYQALSETAASLRAAVLSTDQLQSTLRLGSLSIRNRVGFRATTPDYLPIVGLIPDPSAYKRTYQKLSVDASDSPAFTAPMRDDLYVMAGLGSHGFLTAPLLAEILTGQILQQPGVVAETLRRAISPQRFLLRDIIRSSESL